MATCSHVLQQVFRGQRTHLWESLLFPMAPRDSTQIVKLGVSSLTGLDHFTWPRDRSEDLCVFSGHRKQIWKRQCLASKATSMSRSSKGYVLGLEIQSRRYLPHIYLENHLPLLNLFHMWNFVRCLRIKGADTFFVSSDCL